MAFKLNGYDKCVFSQLAKLGINLSGDNTEDGRRLENEIPKRIYEISSKCQTTQKKLPTN